MISMNEKIKEAVKASRLAAKKILATNFSSI
jgi:hypothetical protein